MTSSRFIQTASVQLDTTSELIFFFISSLLNFIQNISSTKLTGFRTDSISESQNRNLYSAQKQSAGL